MGSLSFALSIVVILRIIVAMAGAVSVVPRTPLVSFRSDLGPFFLSASLFLLFIGTDIGIVAPGLALLFALQPLKVGCHRVFQIPLLIDLLFACMATT